MNNIEEALAQLNIVGYTLDYTPTNEEDFLNSFSISLYNNDGSFDRVSNNPNDFGVTWDLLVNASNLCYLRKRRNSLLKETDKITLKYYSMGEPVPVDVATYQQALRDITETFSSLDNVEWPEKPNTIK